MTPEESKKLRKWCLTNGLVVFFMSMSALGYPFFGGFCALFLWLYMLSLILIAVISKLPENSEILGEMDEDGKKAVRKLKEELRQPSSIPMFMDLIYDVLLVAIMIVAGFYATTAVYLIGVAVQHVIFEGGDPDWWVNRPSKQPKDDWEI